MQYFIIIRGATKWGVWAPSLAHAEAWIMGRRL
jgi:hypothetical protein